MTATIPKSTHNDQMKLPKSMNSCYSVLNSLQRTRENIVYSCKGGERNKPAYGLLNLTMKMHCSPGTTHYLGSNSTEGP